MRVLSSLRVLADFLFRRSRAEREMEEELRSHLRIRAADLEHQGLSREEAERQARIEFGGYQRYKEECREALGIRLLGELLADVRYGLRELRRNPGFTAVAVVTLALGIGANTLIFNVFDTFLLRQLPVREPGQLVRLAVANPAFTSAQFRYIVYQRLRERMRCFSALVLQDDVSVAMNGVTTTERLSAQMVSDNYFDVLGVHALRGRVFSGHDDRITTGNLAVVLSYGFWQRQFGGKAAALGRTLLLKEHPFVVVGVLPQSFRGLEVDSPPDVYIPLAARLLFSPYRLPDRRNGLEFQIVGRLRASVRIAQAQAEFRAFWDRLIGRTQPAPDKEALATAEVQSISRGISDLRNRFSLALKLLFGGVSVLLLVVCANVAALLVTRLATKRREIAIRTALGASRGRLLRQFLTQSILLGLQGGAGGLAIAYAWRPLFVRLLAPGGALLTVSVALNVRIWAYVLGISLLSSIFVGLASSWKATWIDLNEFLKETPTTTLGRTRWTMPQILVTAQIALSLLLLVNAGLLVRSFRKLQAVDPGFDYKRVVQFSVDPEPSGYSPAETKALLSEIRTRLESLPEVRSACFALGPLLQGTGFKDSVAPAGLRAGVRDLLNTNANYVSPGYFRTLGMDFLAGRDFGQRGAEISKPYPSIINESFANHFFPQQDPLGKRFGTGVDMVVQPEFQVVGVVSNLKYRSLREPMGPGFYSPISLLPQFNAPLFLYVRTRTSPRLAIGPVREIVHALAPSLPIFGVETLSQEVKASLWRERLMAVLSSAFGLLAALLAGIGLYGVVAYSTTQRTREIGVRIALGAQGGEVLSMVVAQGLKLAFIGIAIGMAAALGLARLLASILYEVAPSDPRTLVVTSLILTGVTLLACYIPARRATKVEPMAALRYE